MEIWHHLPSDHQAHSQQQEVWEQQEKSEYRFSAMMMITVPIDFLSHGATSAQWPCGNGGPIRSEYMTVTTATPTDVDAWLWNRRDLSAARLPKLAPAMFARRRGSSSSAGAKRGEIIAGVHGEGNVPLSICTSGYSSAYHYPLKEGTNYTNRADHNWEWSCTVMCNSVCPLTAASIDIWIKSNQQWLLIFSLWTHMMSCAAII